MATKVVMEALSPTMEEGRLITWLKKQGDTVKSGDTLAEVETDKAVMELVARGDGVVREVLVQEGETADVGTLVAVIAQPDEDITALLEGAAKTAPEPAVKSETAPAAASAPAAAPRGDHRVKVSPLARRLASEKGVDLATVAGSGPGGRIVKKDLAAVPAIPAVAAVAVPAAAGGYEDIPLSQIRKTIAQRLAQSLGPVPHFFLTVEIDMERTWDARSALNELADDVRISFNDIIVKVTATALTKHRECNAWWMGDHIRYFNEVHISMAVAIEGGLITPVVRNAHLKSLREIATESRDLVERARNRKLAPEEYTGGTFSLSNLGMLDIDHFTAVINPPEAGILAVGRIVQEPVVQDGSVVPRRKMKVTMSCDHRVIDGATGARFLQTFRQMLENPLTMVL